MFRKLRDQTSSKNAVVTPCMTRTKKSQSSTAPSSDETKLNPGGNGFEIACDETPEHDVDGDPGEQRQDARRAAAQQVKLAQDDGGDARERFMPLCVPT